MQVFFKSPAPLNSASRIFVRCKSDGSSLKSLNYANKALYGGVTRKSASPKIENVPLTPARNDLSSEMYWLMQHKPAAASTLPAKRSSSTKRRASVSICAPDEEILLAVKPRKRSAKKDKVPAKTPPTNVTTIPSSLSRFGDTLCKPPLKNLSALVAPAKLLKRSSSDGLDQMLRVPPFHVDGQPFDMGPDQAPIGCERRLEMRDMPSVGKVLQATMPEQSRRALLNWKQLKIAELGIDGFLELQKCESNKEYLR